MCLFLTTFKPNDITVRKHDSTFEPATMDFLLDITHCPTDEKESLVEGVKPWKTAGTRTTGFKVQIFCGNGLCKAGGCLYHVK